MNDLKLGCYNSELDFDLGPRTADKNIIYKYRFFKLICTIYYWCLFNNLQQLRAGFGDWTWTYLITAYKKYNFSKIIFIFLS